MVHLERKGWLWGVIEVIYKFKYFIFVDKKTQGKWQEHRENTGKLQGIWY